MAFGAALAVLALFTQFATLLLDRRYPQQGTAVDVDGARLNVVDLGPRHAAGRPPILLIHGASSNLEAMRQPLGDRLSRTHRVILIDRPGHGRSRRERLTDSTPAIQARMIEQALAKLDVGPVIVVAHSLAGALGLRMACDNPSRVAGLVLLAPVTHPWRGGVGRYNRMMTWPVIGPLLAYTVTLPLGLLIADAGARNVFLPQAMPTGFVTGTATLLLLRPREFLANAWDLVSLKRAVTEQAPRYGAIKLPLTVISGDVDKTVSTDIHARRLAAEVPNTKLIVLPGIGHMVQNAAPDLVISEIDAVAGRLARHAAAAAE